MASVVDLCNLALGHLGDDATVSSIDPPEGSAQAEHCQRFYPIARDQLLAMHTWSFATKRVALGLLNTTELPASWLFCYARPSNCLSAVSVLMPTITDVVSASFTAPAPVVDDTDTQEFIEEVLQDGTQVIFSNVENATLRYITSVTDTTKFTPLFNVALARLLASYLAGPILKGEAGMKVAEAHMQVFLKVDQPRAEAADSRARKVNKYNTFIPDALQARR